MKKLILAMMAIFCMMMTAESGLSIESPIAVVEAATIKRITRSPSLKATRGDGQITLTWNKVPNATRYTIYRSTNKSRGFVAIGTTTSLKYVDKNIAGYYYYKVRAENYKGKKLYSSRLSNVASARTTYKGVYGLDGKQGSMGKLSIPSLGIYLPLYDCSATDNTQKVVDAKDSAAVWSAEKWAQPINSDNPGLIWWVFDHNNQGFATLKNIKKNALVYVREGNLVYRFKVVGVEKSLTKAFKFSNGTSAMAKYLGKAELVLQTCQGRNQRMLVFCKYQGMQGGGTCPTISVNVTDGNITKTLTANKITGISVKKILDAMPEKEGCTKYRGSFTSASRGGNRMMESNVYIHTDGTFNVYYSKNEIKLSFNANGGSGQMDPIKLKYSGTTLEYKAPRCVLTKSGFHFVYWKNPFGGAVYYPGDTIRLSGDITLKAIWEAD